MKWNKKAKAFVDFVLKNFPVPESDGIFQHAKDAFSYEYDLSSTTYHEGHVQAVREGYLGKNKIRILARNNPYVFARDHCGNEATSTCLSCEECVCNQCLNSHECGEEIMHNVVNSPRMGVCGYGGPDRVDNWTPNLK